MKKLMTPIELYNEVIEAEVPQEDMAHWQGNLYLRSTPLIEHILDRYADKVHTWTIIDRNNVFWTGIRDAYALFFERSAFMS